MWKIPIIVHFVKKQWTKSPHVKLLCQARPNSHSMQTTYSSYLRNNTFWERKRQLYYIHFKLNTNVWNNYCTLFVLCNQAPSLNPGKLLRVFSLHYFYPVAGRNCCVTHGTQRRPETRDTRPASWWISRLRLALSVHEGVKIVSQNQREAASFGLGEASLWIMA